MKTNKENQTLSTLWIFVTLNYLYCDVLGLFDAHTLQQLLNGTVEGMEMTEGFLFGAGVLMEIPMIMVVLSRILRNKTNKIANMIAAVIMTAAQTGSLFVGEIALHYSFFSLIEISTTVFIFWYALKKLPGIEEV